jgi:hypothetical protein
MLIMLAAGAALHHPLMLRPSLIILLRSGKDVNTSAIMVSIHQGG